VDGNKFLTFIALIIVFFCFTDATSLESRQLEMTLRDAKLGQYRVSQNVSPKTFSNIFT